MKKTKYLWIGLLLLMSAARADDQAQDQKVNKVSLQDLLSQAGGSPPESTNVAGVRGLEETSGPVDTKARDYPAIERLDHVVIHDEELKKFLDEGKLS